uniref:FBD domain-containing protein n=1 Tax=Heterorhabditis bacteriophora TaxID=37862 RepID=A0A1I7X260_HETBA
MIVKVDKVTDGSNLCEIHKKLLNIEWNVIQLTGIVRPYYSQQIVPSLRCAKWNIHVELSSGSDSSLVAALHRHSSADYTKLSLTVHVMLTNFNNNDTTFSHLTRILNTFWCKMI